MSSSEQYWSQYRGVEKVSSFYQQYCSNKLKLINPNSMMCPIGAHLIWKSSVYKFLVPSDFDQDQERTYKEIWIDVTNSVPPFDTPKQTLGSVLDKIVKGLPTSSLILDFGAGKLRNTIYLLEKGYNVRAVEFEKTQEATPAAKAMYEKARRYGEKFDKLVFPHEFFQSTLKFDLILLINLCNIMPVPAERLLVLQYCREKLNVNGSIFWYTQHGDAEYKPLCVPQFSLGDGYYMNKTKRYQTFYREYNTNEIDAMFLCNGLRYKERYDAYNNQARVYKAVGNNPMKEILTAQKIRRYVKGDIAIEERSDVGIKIITKKDKLEINIPNHDELREERLYKDALRRLPKGVRYATDYHNLMTAILIKLFIPPLKTYKIESEINEGRKRIDLVFTNNPET
ncbi:MAG: class I SAM-dependent methyltransferase, partial [Candidatus Nitrosopolaris sp.]